LLARLFAQPSNLLIMDEPTNDLDADTLELLEEMVANYAGTLLLVSHDRAFLDNVVTSTLVFEGGGEVKEYVGGYSDWLRQRRVGSPPNARSRTAAPNVAAASGAPAALGSATPGSSAAPVLAAPASAPAQSKPRRLSYNEQRELAAMPEKIRRLEAEQLELQATVADPALFQGNDPRGAAALQRLQALAAELESTYARWEALET
jgi:ATP-binding cassette subfamily F protein uup